MKRKEKREGKHKSREILDERAARHDARLAEEAEVHRVGLVQQVQHRIRVLVERRREHHHLEEFPDLFSSTQRARSHQASEGECGDSREGRVNERTVGN